MANPLKKIKNSLTKPVIRWALGTKAAKNAIAKAVAAEKVRLTNTAGQPGASGQSGMIGVSSQSLMKFILAVDARNALLAEEFELMVRLGLTTDAFMHKVLSKLFADRRLAELNDILPKVAGPHPQVYAFHSTHHDIYVGHQTCSKSELSQFSKFVGTSHFLADAIRDNLIRIGVRDRHEDLLSAITAKFHPGICSALKPLSLQGLVNYLIQGGRYQEANRLISDCVLRDPSSEFLFIEQLALTGSAIKNLAELRWDELYDRFVASYGWISKADKDAIQTFVVGPSKKIRYGSAQDFTSIRTNPQKRQEFITLLREKISNKEAFSLIRLGDGESYAYESAPIPGIDPKKFEEDRSLRERVWWQTNIGEEKRQDLKAKVSHSIKRADALGVPSPLRIFRDVNRRGRAFGEAASQRGLASILNQLDKAIPLDHKLIVEERINQVLFSKDVLDDLAGSAEKVVFVGCWDAEQFKLGAPTPIHHIVISAHSRVSEVAKGGRSIVDDYDSIARDVSAHSSPGTLVLVSAGFIGKIFLTAARDAGAVALDIGAVSDYIAGYKTRHVADLL